MLRLAKCICGLVVLGFGVHCASAFSLLGPPPASSSSPDGYQQPVISYQLAGDIGTPKNLGEEYRWNTKTLVYAIDSTFLVYFGSNGVAAIEQAIAILNGLTNFSTYSQELSEFPLDATRVNYQAQALNVADLKSFALGMMVEELGLAEPDRWTWCLRWREALPGLSCPFMHYDVIKRNFDPVTFQPSSYVNGTLYSYEIIEFCTGPDPLAEAVEFPVDPLATTSTAVAALGFGPGNFYTGLTRDDVGGYRYMLRTNNMNWEAVSSDSVLIHTNLATSQLLVTSNLALLVGQALTNNAAALLALYPGLIITSTTPIFTNVVTTNVFALFVNLPGSIAGSQATLVTGTTLTTNVATWYHHTFGNVVINSSYTNGITKILTTNVSATACPAGSPAGSTCTKITLTTASTNAVTGDFYILPPGSCGLSIVREQLVTVIAITNTILTATIAPGTTNVNNQQFSQNAISYFTNHTYVVHPVECQTNVIALRQGMDTFKFVRANYDSLLGTFFQPITNRYTLVAISNSTAYVETFERVISQPDFLFSAEERMTPNGAWHSLGFRTSPGRGGGYNVANIVNPDLVDGPGTREPNIEIWFNKVGPMLINTGPYFLSEISAFPSFIWGSFDASTNAPVIYPDYRSLTDLENQVLIQISPSGPVTNGVIHLPNGTVGSDYAGGFSGFSVTGGQPPYFWGMAPGSAALPPNLVLNANGTISGVPANSTAGWTFDFVIRMSDSGARFVDRPYAIKINP